MSNTRRPSALRAVHEAWGQLPPEVHSSRLTSPGTELPSALAWKTVVIKVTPSEHSRSKLQSDRAVVDEYGERAIRDAILEHGKILANTATLLEAAIRLNKNGDIRHLLANTAFEAAALLDHLPQERVEDVAADLVAEASSRPLRLIEAEFDEPTSAAKLAALLDHEWDHRDAARLRKSTPAEFRSYTSHLGAILAHATFRVENGSWVPHFTDSEAAEQAWSRANELDLALELIPLDKLGLDDGPEQQKPPLATRSRDARPLDTSVRQRARKAAIGARAGGYEDELAPPGEIATAAVEAASSPLGLSLREARTGLALGAFMLMDADPEADPKGVGVQYASRKLSRLMTVMRKSARSDRGRMDRLHHAIASVMPKLWIALHNLEYRGDVARDLAEVWKRVGGEPETLVREFKNEFERERAEDDDVTVLGIGTPGARDPGTSAGDPAEAVERAEEAELARAAGRPDAETMEEVDDRVGFTIGRMREVDAHACQTVLELTENARRAAIPFDEARSRWNTLLDCIVDAHLPVGEAEDEPPRYVTRDDLAGYDELLQYLDRHFRRTDPGIGSQGSE